MSDLQVSLGPLGIEWASSPRLWHTVPRTALPYCNSSGDIIDASGVAFHLKPVGNLGAGTFGTVDIFQSTNSRNSSTRQIAVKRPKHASVDLLLEALFQWKLHNDLKLYGLAFSIPEVYNIFTFKPSGDVWFSMKAYEPQLLSSWCMTHLTEDSLTFGFVILQIALILEVIQEILHIDHRDLKVNNMLVVDEPVEIEIEWHGSKKTIHFPFYIDFIDFGFACYGKILDVKEGGLPPIDLCPKNGRDIFQVVVSLWRIDSLRVILEKRWGAWIRHLIESANPCPAKGLYLRLTESSHTLNWLYSVTDNRSFTAPLCAPSSIIRDCMKLLEC